MIYRNDIDGLRAISVIAVIFFHLGLLPNGYLGVDVFFVISGYLITTIIYHELTEKKFTITGFYERRIRRILPLLFSITSLALILGVLLMLPDDLENLAQSVVASNISANNILMLITSSDYWAAKNEYKPLMHTWSLGIEEQFYIIYPFLFVLFSKFRLSMIKYLLLLMSGISIFLFLNTYNSANSASKFYLLPFRFFELSAGGFFALYSNPSQSGKYKKTTYALYQFSFIVVLLLLVVAFGNNELKVILTTVATAVFLATGKQVSKTAWPIKRILQNRVLIYVGKISFSLYLWHQLIFAFARYAFFNEIKIIQVLLLLGCTFLLSTVTYHFIETPFRSRREIKTSRVYLIVACLFILCTLSGFYFYGIGGVYKDFPSLGMQKLSIYSGKLNSFSSSDNIHIHYNEEVRKLDKDFSADGRHKILVIGDSYGRDAVNILLESEFSDSVDISYFDINRIKKDSAIISRWNRSCRIILAVKGFLPRNWVEQVCDQYDLNLDWNRIHFFGTKEFGYSNGIHYNRLHSITDFSKYFTNLHSETLELEMKLKREWGSNYISLITPAQNGHGQIRVFTDDGKFISQDTLHLTKFGAIFYAKLLAGILTKLLC